MRSENVKIASGINVIAGLWLMLSSYVLGFAGTSIGTGIFFVGLVVAILALIQEFSTSEITWPSWINAILGIWLLISPAFLTEFTMSAMWNSVILGIIVIAMSLWSALSASSTMGRGHPKMG